MLYFIVVFGGVFVVLSLLSVVANDSGPPFQRSARVNPNPIP